MAAEDQAVAVVAEVDQAAVAAAGRVVVVVVGRATAELLRSFEAIGGLSEVDHELAPFEA